MFTLWSLIEATMLCLNAVCILHEERFLAKGNKQLVCQFWDKIYSNHFNFYAFSVGWGANSAMQSFGEPTTKAQLLNLIRSIRTVAKSKSLYCFHMFTIYIKDYFDNILFVCSVSVPLIFLNIVAIVFKLLLG